MFKRFLVTLSALFLLVLAMDVGRAGASVDVRKAEVAKRVLKRALFPLMIVSNDRKYKSVAYDEKKKAIIFTDVTWVEFDGVAHYKTLRVTNYQEGPVERDYSFDEARLEDGVHKAAGHVPDSVSKENLTKKDASQIPSPAQYNVVYDVKGSDSRQVVTFERQKIKGLGVSGYNSIGLSEIEIESGRTTFTNIDKLIAVTSKLVEFSSGNNLSSEQAVLLYDGVALLFSNIEMEEALVTNLPTMNPLSPYEVKLGRIKVGKLKKGVLEKITFEDIQVIGPGNPDYGGTIKEFSVKGIDFKAFADFSKNAPVPGSDLTPEIAGMLLKIFRGFAVGEVDAKFPAARMKLDLDFGWNEFVGLFPTKVSVDGKTELAVPKGEEGSFKSGIDRAYRPVYEMAWKYGINKLNLRLQIKAEWDEKENKVVLSPVLTDVEQLFNLSMSVTLENVTKEMFLENDPEKLAIMAIGVSVGPIALEITDKGAQAIYAGEANDVWEAISSGVTSDANISKVIDNVTKLLGAPKGKLRISLKPKSKVNFAQLGVLFATGPDGLAALFEIESEYIAQ